MCARLLRVDFHASVTGSTGNWTEEALIRSTLLPAGGADEMLAFLVEETA